MKSPWIPLISACLLVAACDVGPGGSGSESCGSFTGTACEQVVKCCDFVQQANPGGEAAATCVVKRPVAEQALSTSQTSDDAQCDPMLDDPGLAECELSCEPAASNPSTGGNT